MTTLQMLPLFALGQALKEAPISSSVWMTTAEEVCRRTDSDPQRLKGLLDYHVKALVSQPTDENRVLELHAIACGIHYLATKPDSDPEAVEEALRLLATR